MSTGVKLILWFAAIVLIGALNPSLTPPTFWDRMWARAAVCAFPVGAFFAARGARSGIPFIIYGGAAAALHTWLDWQEAASINGRWNGVSDWAIIMHELKPVVGLVVACRVAASLRWWVTRRRERPREPRCAKCGYLLYGLPEPRCPECGEPFDETLLSAKDVAEPREG
jgi:hypothetical protein